MGLAPTTIVQTSPVRPVKPMIPTLEPVPTIRPVSIEDVIFPGSDPSVGGDPLPPDYPDTRPPFFGGGGGGGVMVEEESSEEVFDDARLSEEAGNLAEKNLKRQKMIIFGLIGIAVIIAGILIYRKMRKNK